MSKCEYISDAVIVFEYYKFIISNRKPDDDFEVFYRGAQYFGVPCIKIEFHNMSEYVIYLKSDFTADIKMINKDGSFSSVVVDSGGEIGKIMYPFLNGFTPQGEIFEIKVRKVIDSSHKFKIFAKDKETAMRKVLEDVYLIDFSSPKVSFHIEEDEKAEFNRDSSSRELEDRD